MDLRSENLYRPMPSVADALAIVSRLYSRQSSPHTPPDAATTGRAACTLTGDPGDSFAQLLRSRLKTNV